MISVKKGVKVQGLKQVMFKAYEVYDNLYRLTGNQPVITDVMRSDSSDSLHNLGYALDVRARDVDQITGHRLTWMIRQILGDDYDVIYYPKTKHIHIEYQKYLDIQRECVFDVEEVE